MIRFAFLQSKSYILTIFLLTSPLLPACPNPIDISAGKNWPPYSYYQNKKYNGLDIEIIEMLLEHAGLCFRYISYPSSSRAFEEFKKNQVDFIFAASYTSKRAEYSTFSLPYRLEIMQMFTRRDHPKPWDMSPRATFAVNRGSIYGEQFKQLTEQCNNCIVHTNLAEERLLMLQKRRVDYAVEDLLSGIYLLQKLNLNSELTVTKTAVNTNLVYFMLNQNTLSPQQIDKINEAIRIKKPAIKALVLKYQNRSGLEP